MKTTPHYASSIRSLVASALVGCLATLAVTWPGTLHAVDEDEAAEAANEEEVPEGATQVEGVLATTEIVTDEKSDSVRVHLVATNPSKEHQVAKLSVQVQQYEINPMARSAPPPEVRFEETAHIIVPPGERFEKDLLLPPDLAQAIRDSRKPREEAPPAADEEPPTEISYTTAVLPAQDVGAAG
jgi:hypothetical protein